MGFTLVFIQELIQGKGVIQGIQEGNPVNLAIFAATVVFLVGFTGFLALKGENSYVDEELKKL